MGLYLKHVKAGSFGLMHDRVVGPLSPHLNIVFGENEAGKTTLSSLIGGVLFGWEEARGGRNTYKPRGAERSGALFFAEREGADAEELEGAAVVDAGAHIGGGAEEIANGGVEAGASGDAEEVARGVAEDSASTSGAAFACASVSGATSAHAAHPGANHDETLYELRRVRNADGLQGDASIVADIDKETFRTVFSFSSDTLRSLQGSTDITAKLLTAGSGTGSSPATALVQVQERLAEYTSRAASARNSIVRLVEERDEIRQSLRLAADDMEKHRAQDREFHAIEPERQAVTERLTSTNALVESLTACRAGLEKLDAEQASLTVELEHLHNDERRAVASRRSREQAVGRQLARLSGAQDRAARERIEALSDRKSKLSHQVDAARSERDEARAAYEAVCAAQGRAHEQRPRARRSMQVGVPAAMFALLVCLGVPLFMQGRAAGSLSYMSLGLFMVFFGLLLAASALILLFRPDRRGEELAARVEGAHELLVQCEKRLEQCEESWQELLDSVDAELAEMGLAAAGGSLRRARVLLDDAKDARAEMALDRQRQQAATQRVDEVEARLGEIVAQRRLLAERVGMPDEVTVAELDQEIARRSAERAELMEKADSLNRRWGELSRELAQAREVREFDKLKTRSCELKTRIDEASVGLARMLLVRRVLEEAVAAWKSKSQPEVYAQASRLMAIMTGGRWTRVELTDEGVLQVRDCTLAAREPGMLSLGTCQQLYLALRIALLKCAPNVGRAIPVVADDILVNFDAARRRGAARALVELAETRQVILLTCHKEVVEVLEEAAVEAGRPVALVRL